VLFRSGTIVLIFDQRMGCLMKAWTSRALRAVVFGILTAGFVAWLRSRTGDEAETVLGLAIRAVAFGLGYFIADGLRAMWRSRRRVVVKAH
jgi:ABC-type Mn2+/Zn2+ transport system permease subunit